MPGKGWLNVDEKEQCLNLFHKVSTVTAKKTNAYKAVAVAKKKSLQSAAKDKIEENQAH